MLPYLHLGSLSIPTFGLFLWLGGVAAAYVMHRNFLRNGVKNDAITVVTMVMIAGVIGAKAWHELQYPATLMQEMRNIFLPGWGHPLHILTNMMEWFRAGFAWFGGLLAGIAMLMYQGYSRYEGVRTGAVRMLDLSAAATAIGYGVGRIGCLTSGDGDYGIATTVPWGVHIHDDALDPPRPNPPGLLVHPTPIYEFLFGLALGAYLWVRGKKKLPTGQILGEYLALSGLGRFLVEFWRRNPRLYFGMSNAQVAAALSCLVGIAIIVLARRYNKHPELA